MLFGIISDAHGNLPALELALRILDEKGCDRLFFLGDAVGYFVGVEVLRLLQERGIVCIRGNHEQMLLNAQVKVAPEYGLEDTRSLMTDGLWRFVSGWPLSLRLETPAGSVLLVHGSPDDPLNGRLYPDTDLCGLKLEDDLSIFMGHTHRPMIRQVSSTRLVNVGSVGLPRDDGTLGCVCTVDGQTGRVSHIRFRIDALPRPSTCANALLESVWARRARDPIGELYGS